MIRVLVSDDHELVRFGIVRMLEDIEDIVVVGQATSGEEAVTLCRDLKPDVALMDLRMPGIGGLEATRKIVQRSPEIRVVGVSVCDQEPLPSQFLKAGAMGYVTKGSSFDEILNAIRTVHKGERFISPSVAQSLALSSVSGEQGSPFDQLSQRELQISLMIANCEKVQTISDKLNVSPKTVNSYRYRIFEKLNVNSDVELTLLALSHGVIELPRIESK